MLKVSSNVATHLVGYCCELYRERNEIVDTVNALGIDGEAAQYLIDYPRSSTAGTTLLCRQIYDIAEAGQSSNEAERRQLGRIGGLLLLLTDIVDSQVDKSEVPLDVREHYLDAGRRALLFGDYSDVTLENRHERVSLYLARFMHENVVQRDERKLFTPLFNELVTNAKRQLSSGDPNEHLNLAIKVGAACALIGVVCMEHLTGVDQQQARVAAESLGAYAECLDHAYEMRGDLRGKVPTYATLYLLQHGDTLANRRQAKADLLDTASDIYRAGLAQLDGEQKLIYMAACRMLDVRYRVIKHIMDGMLL